MVGQSFRTFGQSVRIESFNGLHDPGVKGAPSLMEQAAIGNLTGEGVLEGVLKIRKKACLV